MAAATWHDCGHMVLTRCGAPPLSPPAGLTSGPQRMGSLWRSAKDSSRYLGGSHVHVHGKFHVHCNVHVQHHPPKRFTPAALCLSPLHPQVGHARFVRMLAVLCPRMLVEGLAAPLTERMAAYPQPSGASEKAEQATVAEVVAGLLAAGAPFRLRSGSGGGSAAAAGAEGEAAAAAPGPQWVLDLMASAMQSTTLDLADAWGVAARYAASHLTAAAAPAADGRAAATPPGEGEDEVMVEGGSSGEPFTLLAASARSSSGGGGGAGAAGLERFLSPGVALQGLDAVLRCVLRTPGAVPPTSGAAAAAGGGSSSGGGGSSSGASLPAGSLPMEIKRLKVVRQVVCALLTLDPCAAAMPLPR